jgi:hypothetical protein
MKLDSLLMLGLTALLLGACAGQKGVSPCATDLEYITNINTYGIDTLTQSSAYMASLFVGADDSYISAKLDTGSSELVVNEDDFVAGVNTQLGKNGYSFNHGNKSTVAINAVDSMQIGCSATIDTRFAITSKNLATGNILGLAFGDTERLAHEAFNKPFFDQLVKSNGFKDVFSLSLCASRARSHVLFGGIDNKMKNRLNNMIPIIEKSSYVVPALTLRLADTKEVLGHFPVYNPKKHTGKKTILDTGVSFNLFPTEMAERAAEKVIARAKELGLYNKLPHGFFRTERSANSSVTRFRNLAQIRQFPSFEITFEGADGNIKALELSPLHYFKEMSNFDPLVRSFGIRESKGPIVLGQPFLENHYIVIDRKNALIAFGDINYACSP